MKRILLFLFTLASLVSIGQSIDKKPIGWKKTGNVLGNNTSFFGTTDNRSVNFKTNNTLWRKLDSLGVDRTYTTAAVPTINGSRYYSITDGITHYVNDDANYQHTWTNGVHKLSIYLATSTGSNAVSCQLYTQSTSTCAFALGAGTKQGVLIEPSNGFVGIGTINRNVLNARMQIAAGSTAVPAIALTAQSAVTSPTNGNIWYEAATGFNFRGSVVTNSTVTTPTVNGTAGLYLQSGAANRALLGIPSGTLTGLWTGPSATSSTTANYAIQDDDANTRAFNANTTNDIRVAGNTIVRSTSTGAAVTGIFSTTGNATINAQLTATNNIVSSGANPYQATNVGNDLKFSSTRTGGKNWTIQHDGNNFYFYNQTDGFTSLELNNSGRVYLAGGGAYNSTPTAKLHIAAGTTTASTAPIKLTSGSLMTSPEAGAVEYDGTDFYVTPSSASRQWVMRGFVGTATLDFPSTLAGAVSNLTLTVTGAADGDVVDVGVPNASMPATGTFEGYVSSANTVTIRYANNSLTLTQDPASGTFKATVIKN